MTTHECHLCKSQRSPAFLCKVTLTGKTDYDLVQCPECDIIYFSPMASTADLEEFYSASYYDFDRHREEGKGMAFAKRLSKIQKTGKFLDVGCATGFFINGIKNNSSWNVYGTDFGKSAVDFAREKLGLDVYHTELPAAPFEEKMFDYIHINNVLEHVPDPVGLMASAKKFLKNDGILYLSVPNGENDSLELIDYYNEEKRAPVSKSGHIFFFPASTLKYMFKKLDLEAVISQTYSIKRGLRNKKTLKRKSSWKEPYILREKTENQSVKTGEEKKKKSDFYYRYRFTMGELVKISGLHNIGLDYQFILKKS
jgi:SAM-dependent methyltransferase